MVELLDELAELLVAIQHLGERRSRLPYPPAILLDDGVEPLDEREVVVPIGRAFKQRREVPRILHARLSTRRSRATTCLGFIKLRIFHPARFAGERAGCKISRPMTRYFFFPPMPSSSAVQPFVRSLNSARVFFTASMLTGAAVCSHSRRM